MSLKLPAISTASIPIRSSSTAGSSPITPLSDLSGSSGGKYCIYPSATTPTRELTPPPTTSRFAPLFKSISYEGDNDNVARGASIPLTGPHHSNPFDSQPTFSPTISRPVPSNLSFVPRSSYVEPAPRSAPLRVSHPSPWQNPTRAAEHIEKLNDVIQGLRHQLNLKSFDLDTAESELAQVSEAYALLVKEKAIVTHRFARAQERVEELELQVRAGQRYMVSQVPSRSQFAYPTARTESEGDDFKPWSDFQHLEHREQRHSIWEDRLKPIDLNTLRRNSIPETEGASSAVSAEDSKGHTTPDKDAVQAVLTSAPTLPECDLSRVDAKFLHPSFDFALWVKTCGLKLPAKILLLACVGWKDRLEMTDQKLAAIGVDNDNDRAYILRVFYSVSNGESPCLDAALAHKDFTNEQYVAIMREQRIDKHVPNLANIPWPQRLFLNEQDLEKLEVQKAGARGTILTVFGGLRKGCPRPDPRPRRGTKKTRRGRAGGGGGGSSMHDDDAKSSMYDGASAGPPRSRPYTPIGRFVRA